MSHSFLVEDKERTGPLFFLGKMVKMTKGPALYRQRPPTSLTERYDVCQYACGYQNKTSDA